MSATLSEQLSMLPLLTTVLRVDFDLLDNDQSFFGAKAILAGWAYAKALQHGVQLPPDVGGDLTRSSGRFVIDIAESDRAWAVTIEHPDGGTRETNRTWICEIGLDHIHEVTRFSTRLSYRQPMNSSLPEPRAPKYISEVVRKVGAVDSRILEGTSHHVTEADVSELAELLESKSRRLPVIAISQDDVSGDLFCSPDRFADFNCGIAHVVRLDPRATWGLTTLWGERWSAYRGAVRCYAPGLNHETGDPFQHRLWLPAFIQRCDANYSNGFLNQCLRHVFATVTAQFESFPLLSPAAVRRRVAELHAAQRATVAELTAEDVSAEVIVRGPIWVDTIPSHPEEIANQQILHREYEDQALREKNLTEQVDILTSQLKALESQLQEARNHSAQERMRFENLQDELELYKQVNTELELKIAVLTGQVAIGGSEVVRSMWASFSGFFQSLQNLSESYKRVETEGIDRDQILDDLEAAKSENHSLRAQIEILRSRKSELPVSRAELKLNDPESLRDFMCDQPFGRVEILASAEKSYRDYPLNDLGRMTEGLTILRDLYLPMKICANDGHYFEEFNRRLEAGKFKFGPSAKEATRKHNEDDHTVKLASGRRIGCEKIRDKTTNMNWQFFFGVYFAWDEEEKVLYLKGFGHGESPSAHT